MLFAHLRRTRTGKACGASVALLQAVLLVGSIFLHDHGHGPPLADGPEGLHPAAAHVHAGHHYEAPPGPDCPGCQTERRPGLHSDAAVIDHEALRLLAVVSTDDVEPRQPHTRPTARAPPLS